jgi:hypothetical protein
VKEFNVIFNKGENMKTKEIIISFQNNEIILRHENIGDTFVGDVASKILHYFNRIKADTMPKRLYVFRRDFEDVIQEKTGLVYCFSK